LLSRSERPLWRSCNAGLNIKAETGKHCDGGGDFQGEATTGFDDPVFNGDNRANIDIGAHLTWWRTPFHAVGLLAGYSDTRIVDDISMQRATLGVEGQLHFPDVTLYGQAGGSFFLAGTDNHAEPVTGP
jgi:hypothetical protein